MEDKIEQLKEENNEENIIPELQKREEIFLIQFLIKFLFSLQLFLAS